ncbi:uncharacterized protein [Argopecten irradians]|uniref:uncharacterized protein n=1 Tax=Argopecten irradians TaxID=31199 RepID=UPI0037231740
MDLFKLVREEWEKCLTNPDCIDTDTLVREEWEKCLTNPDCIDTDTLVREEWEKCLTNPDCIDTDTLVREKWEKCLTNSDCLDTDTLAREEWEKCLTNPDCIDTDTLVREEWEKCLTNPDFIDTDTLVREEWEKCLTNPVCIDSDTLVREEWEKCLTNSDSIDTDTLVREKWEKCLTNSDCLDTDTPTPPPSLTQPIDCLSVEDKAPRTDISDDSERENHIENKMKPHTSSQDRMKEKVLNPVKFLHKNCRSLGWDPPVYRFDSLTQETFICKVLVNGREYHSEVCSTHKEAKSSAAQAFFTHHQRSETDTYIDIMGQFFSNTKVEKYSGLDVVSALNIAAQKFGWVPRYQFDTLPSGQCVCKALIDGKEYWSGPCSDEKEAKFAAAETFFACHQKSENDTYTEMLQSWMKKPRKKSQAAEVHDGMSPGFFLHTTCVKHHWPIPVYKLVSKTRYEGHYQYIYKVNIYNISQ